MAEPTKQDRALLAAIFSKMDTVAMSVAVGVVASLGLFIATAILLLQDVPTGFPIGAHLNLLQDYLPGYMVSWPGSLFGLFYGFLVGSVCGYLVALTWNFTHYLALGALLMKAAVMAD